VRGTPFEGLDRPRLVQFCDNTKRTAPYILQEYQLYRIYHLFTPMSFRARLAHVTYVDSGSTRPFARRWAFFLEEPAALEARTGTTAEPLRLGGDDLDPSARTLMGVFQYMIGNTDWSTMGLHNVAVFRRDSVFLPVPFDFDYSGAVNAHYAGVAPSVNIPNVRTRLYRGHCAPDSVFARTFAAFADRQPAIDSLYTDTIGRLLPEDVRRRTREYFAEFHRTIGDPARARRQIISRCLPNQ